MQEITWVGVVGVLLLLSQLLNIYNSSKTAKKNAAEPLEEVRKSVSNVLSRVGELEYRLGTAEQDLNRAYEKIRENERAAIGVAKAQNKALLAILFWMKDPEHEDKKRIEDAINDITNL